MKAIKKLLNILSLIVLVCLVILVLFFFMQRISGNNSGVMGYQILRISSGSMEPDLQVGDVILSQKTSPETLEKGDIITYNGIEGSYAGKSVTHQIVKGPYERDGQLYFITKGTANYEEDPEISENQILGKMQFKIPLVGYIYSFFMTPYGLAIIILIILLAFSNEIFTLIKLGKEKVENNVQREFDEEHEKATETTSQDEKQNIIVSTEMSSSGKSSNSDIKEKSSSDKG